MRRKLHGDGSAEDSAIVSEMVFYPDCGTIFLGGEISDGLIPQLVDIVMHAGKNVKYLIIQSEGGDAYAGFGIGDIIDGLNLTTIGIGRVFSMGAYLFSLGKVRWCLPNTSFLVHAGNAFGGGPTPYSQAQSFQDFWGKHLVNQYLDVTVGRMRSSQSKQLRKDILAGKEFWFDSQQAKRLGFVDKIIKFNDVIKKLGLPCIVMNRGSDDDED